MNRIDQLLVSHDSVDALTNGNNYGSDINLEKAGIDGAGGFRAVVRIMEAYPSAATTVITIDLCSGPAASPTAVVQEVWSGQAQDLTLGLELKTGIIDRMDKYARFNVNCAATQATGQVFTTIMPSL